ncbi:MAG TPA: ATP synthase F1 subunit delta [Tepidiformaceae bacterium]|nr:ATP synthase F1 subunit delta [Tepidiformaceae bacterium]
MAYEPEAAKRYAQAAFGLAVDSGTVDHWRAELNDIATVLAESQLATTLADGRVPLDQRLAILDRVLDVTPLALNLAKVLVRKGRSLAAREVATAYGRLADEHAGIAHAQVTSAVELDSAQVAAIEQKLSSEIGKTVRATVNVDPALVGGLTIRVGDKLLDTSVRTRLRMLRRQLEGAR